MWGQCFRGYSLYSILYMQNNRVDYSIIIYKDHAIAEGRNNLLQTNRVIKSRRQNVDFLCQWISL